MKVALITPWYGNFAGGAESLARNLVENLVKCGIPAEVLTTCAKSPFDSWWADYHPPGRCEIHGVRVTRFPVNKSTEHGYHAANYRIISGSAVSRSTELDYLRGSISSDDLIAFVEKHRYEYVFLLIPYIYGLTYWAYRAAPERCVLIPCIHDEPQAYFSTTREMMRCCRLAFNSPEEMLLARRIQEIPPDKAWVCGCGVDLPPVFNPEKFRRKFAISYPYLLYAGRKDAGKNLPDLINYFSRYKKMHQDDLRMVFIGGGDDSLIPDRDFFVDLGYLSEEDKFNAYAGAFACCLLSKNESFSFVIMESWGASAPCIVSDDCPVTRGHCMRSNGGLPVRGADEFCAAITYLREHPAVRAGLGSRGRDYVLKNFAWSEVIRRYTAILKTVEERES